MNVPPDRCLVLDDDPTGTQALHGVPVLLRWTVDSIRACLDSGAPSVHLMTNTRSLPPDEARRVTADAAAVCRAAAPEARIVLRGDSTLRGHLLEELLAVGGERSVLLLVPALPSAGRVTRGGIHLVERDGVSVPVAETEYATDGGFAYTSSRLLDWAQERSSGLLPAARGTEVPLARLRDRGAAAVAEALAEAARNGLPAACAPDAETIADLECIAAGLRSAEAAGVPVVVRCAPAFAAVLADRLAGSAVDPPPAGAGVLVVCGSYVASTTRQLERLQAARGVAAIEVDVEALAGEESVARDAVLRAAEAASRELAERRLAVVATSRDRPAATRSLDVGLRIARRLASVVGLVEPTPGVVVAKGGITSHVTLVDGIRADRAMVVGPLLPGVAVWSAEGPGGPVSYVVVPGNVGGPELLVELVERLGVGAADREPSTIEAWAARPEAHEKEERCPST